MENYAEASPPNETYKSWKSHGTGLQVDSLFQNRATCMLRLFNRRQLWLIVPADSDERAPRMSGFHTLCRPVYLRPVKVYDERPRFCDERILYVL